MKSFLLKFLKEYKYKYNEFFHCRICLLSQIGWGILVRSGNSVESYCKSSLHYSQNAWKGSREDDLVIYSIVGVQVGSRCYSFTFYRSLSYQEARDFCKVRSRCYSFTFYRSLSYQEARDYCMVRSRWYSSTCNSLLSYQEARDFFNVSTFTSPNIFSFQSIRTVR